jgi:Holliday junction resolvase RusA-like endonuclease
MKETLRLEVPGEPISGSQLKFNRSSGTAYRPKAHSQRVFTIHEYAANAVPEEERPYFGNGIMVWISVEFYFPYRKSDYRTGKYSDVLKDSAPEFVIGNKDLDNLLKPLKDGLKGVAISDDKQIVMYTGIVKKYSQSPKTVVQIGQING